MKYIVLRQTCQKSGMTRDFPIIFPNDLTHADVAHALSAQVGGGAEAQAISAGEISSMAFESGDFCHGKSTTLKVKSRPKEDSDLIRMHDYLHGI